MAIRFTVKSKSRLGVPGLPSGYEAGPSSGLTLPSVGIDDVDRALFNLFNEEIPVAVSDKGGEVRKVPIIFTSGEKWALSKKLRSLRDKNNTLILPLISVVRTSIVQSMSEDIAGRGINQQTGEIVVHRRLDKSDRSYQNVVNRLSLKHQNNLAVTSGSADVGQLSTTRAIGDLQNDAAVLQGALLLPNNRNNVYETIVIPSPQFFTAKYEVTVWAQYITHMNQIIEVLLSSFLPQGNAWRLETGNGYWFIATVDDNSYSSDSNDDDFSQTERIIRYKFNVSVPCYVLASSAPGVPLPIRRYVSSPTITFNVSSGESAVDTAEQTSTLLGSDDPTLPKEHDLSSTRQDQRNTSSTRLYPHVDSVNPEDPALTTYPRGKKLPKFKRINVTGPDGKVSAKYFRVKGTNSRTGETVLSYDASLDGFDINVDDE